MAKKKIVNNNFSSQFAAMPTEQSIVAPAPAPRTRRSSDDAAQAWRRLVGRGSLLVALAGLAAAAAWLSPGAQPRAMEQTSPQLGSGSRRHRLASAIARSAGMTQALAALGRTEALAATRAQMLKVVCRRCVLLCVCFPHLACSSHKCQSVIFWQPCQSLIFWQP